MDTSPSKQESITPGAIYLPDICEYARDCCRLLSAVYDPQTIRHLERREIEIGWSCLEVGGCGGSIASWLRQRVGDQGHVLATDIGPCFLPGLPFDNLEVHRPDLGIEELGKAEFDLVHSRLVLMHLPGREVALHRMIKSLKPGGWIVVEEFDAVTIFADSAANPEEEQLNVPRAFYQVMTSRGVEMRYGRRLAQQLRNRGLVNVGAEASMSIWQGRSQGIEMLKLSLKELAHSILGSGLMTDAEFEADMKRLDELDFLMPSPMMWTAWGQVPKLSS